MRKLTPTIPILVAGALVALALAEHGGARPAESVKCSSTDPSRDALGRPIDLTGMWRANDRQIYQLRQIGSCLWWTGSKAGSNVFFGRISGSTVVGVWTDVLSRSAGTNGSLSLVLTASNTVLLRRSSTGRLVGRILRKIG